MALSGPEGVPLHGRGPPSSPARGGLHVADVQGMDRPSPGAWGATATAVAGRVVMFGQARAARRTAAHRAVALQWIKPLRVRRGSAVAKPTQQRLDIP